MSPLDPVSILLGLLTLMLGFGLYFVRLWMNRVDSALESLLTHTVKDGEFKIEIGKIEKALDRLWKRANNHTHQIKCARKNDQCDAEIGSVVIQSGGQE